MRILKALIALALAALIVGVGAMIFVVKSKYAVNDFNVDLNMAFNAATMVNAEETLTDEENAVICEYDGQRVVLLPENYRVVSFYLRKGSRMMLFDRADRDAALYIGICDTAHIYVSPDGDNGLFIRWEAPDGNYNMHAIGSGIWESLLTACLDGTARGDNIPLTD